MITRAPQRSHATQDVAVTQELKLQELYTEFHPKTIQYLYYGRILVLYKGKD